MMKVYTQEEFNRLPVIDGIRRCPAGDYYLLKDFGDRCSFDSGSIFGKDSRFGDGCIFGKNN